MRPAPRARAERSFRAPMTVLSQPHFVRLNAPSGMSTAPFGFDVGGANHVRVRLITSSAPAPAWMTYLVDFRVQLAVGAPGGTVIFTPPLSEAGVLEIERFTPRVQQRRFENIDRFPEEAVEGGLDDLALALQEADEANARAIKFGRGVDLPREMGAPAQPSMLVVDPVAGVTLVPVAGFRGEDGDDGEDGEDGANGASWRLTEGVPSAGVGVDGDFCLNLSTGDVYGPKAGGWGSPVGNLRGPAGGPGPAGSGSGDVLGPATHGANAFPRFNNSANSKTLVARSASELRDDLGLGAAALEPVGTSGAVLVRASGANFFGASNHFDAGLSVRANAQNAVEMRRASSNTGTAIGAHYRLHNSDSSYVDYARVLAQIASNAAGAEVGNILLQVAVGGAITTLASLNGAGNFEVRNGPLLVPAGSASAPAIAGSGDTNTGIEFSGSDVLRFVTGGARRWRITAGGSLAADGAFAILSGDGSAALPSIGFINDIDSGFFSAGANNVALSLGGAKYVDFSAPSVDFSADIKRGLPAAGVSASSVGYLGAGPTNAQTANHTCVIADEGHALDANSGASLSFTINTGVHSENAILFGVNIGAGGLTIARGAGITFVNGMGANADLAVAQNKQWSARRRGTSNTWDVRVF